MPRLTLSTTALSLLLTLALLADLLRVACALSLTLSLLGSGALGSLLLALLNLGGGTSLGLGALGGETSLLLLAGAGGTLGLLGLAFPLLTSLLLGTVTGENTGKEARLLLGNLGGGGLAGGLELGLLLRLDGRAGESVVGHHAAKTGLELDSVLLLGDSSLASLSVDTVVGLAVVLLLALVVGNKQRALLLAVGTLEVVDALGNDTQALVELALLLGNVLDLHGNNLGRVKVLVLDGVDVDLETVLVGELLGKLAGLLATSLVHHLLQAVELGLASSLLLGTGSLLGELLGALGTGSRLLALATEVGLLEKLAALLDNEAAVGNLLALLLGLGKSRSEGLGTRDNRGRVEVLDGAVEVDGQVGEAVEVRGGSGKVDSLGDVVNSGVEVTAARSSHEELLKRGHVSLPGSAVKGLDKRKDVLEGDGLVDARELLDKAGENDVAEGREVGGKVGRELGDNGSEELASLEGLEVDLDNVVELTDVGGDTLEVLGTGVLHKGLTGRHLGEVEESNKTLLGLNVTERDSEGREKDSGGGTVRNSAGTLGVLVVASPGGGVEDGGLLATLGTENLSELLVVVGHHGGLGTLLAGNEAVDVLDRAESLLPELELDGSLELKEASVEVTREGLGVGEVDGVLLVAILGGVGKVLAETLLAKTAENLKAR
ncbi:uncharacterized protein LOC62_02G002135 [Vanrija pseudolonga]|uniref:Uncharacterized protein n=1 Tax=Vanrija pseudolonga TaxID=143232 RepID=A0AAF0Y5G0_9TREE|nr:hypothetical protein LOC62_02G002135 [Vanrija pseudolonga]